MPDSHQSSLLNGSESVSESVSQSVSDKHCQWSDSGPIKISLDRSESDHCPPLPLDLLMLWRLDWCDSGFKHATNTLGDKGRKCRWLLGVPFLKSYCGQVYFFGIVTRHSGVVLPKFGSQLPVFIEPVCKEGQKNYNFTVPWGQRWNLSLPAGV